MIRRTLKMICALVVVFAAVLAGLLAYCHGTGQAPWELFGVSASDLAKIAIDDVKGAT